MSQTPVTILGGYLGAGKTTLVNHLLRHAGGRRIAVLVNDFGAVPIDADLIESDEGGLLSLAGGCVCCSYGDDLVRALIDLGTRTPAPDHVVIETSGVALPGAVARSLTLLFAFRLDAIVVLADAVTTAERLDDPYMGDTLARQFDAADVIVVNKADLVDAVMRDALVERLSTSFYAARIIATTRGAIVPEVLLGVDLARPRGRAVAGGDGLPHASLCLYLTGTADLRVLADELLAAGLVRAKGFIRATDGGWLAVHLAGRRVTFDASPADIEEPQRLVCIAARPTIDPQAIEAALTRAGLTPLT